MDFYKYISCLFKVPLKSMSKHNTPVSNRVNEVLIYGADNEDERKNAGMNNLLCIYYTILHACHSIDICIPQLKSETLCQCLLKVRKRSSVKIRLVLYNYEANKSIESIASNGIDIKIGKLKIQLEYQFILIDANGTFDDPLAIMGNFGYDIDQVNRNRDSTLFTSENKDISVFKREFERVWSNTEPLKGDSNSNIN